MADESISDVVHESQAFVLLSQLFLICACRLMCQSNIHRNCYLRSQLLHKLQIGIGVRVGLPASEGNRPIGLFGRGQWKYVVRSDAALSEHANVWTKAVLISEITEQKRLLVLPYPSRRGIANWQFERHGDRDWNQGLQHIQPHDLSGGVVQHKIEKIDSANLLETFKKVPKQFR